MLALALEHISKRRVSLTHLGDDSAIHAMASRIISPTAERFTKYMAKAYGVNQPGQGSARLARGLLTCDDRASFCRTPAEP